MPATRGAKDMPIWGGVYRATAASALRLSCVDSHHAHSDGEFTRFEQHRIRRGRPAGFLGVYFSVFLYRNAPHIF